MESVCSSQMLYFETKKSHGQVAISCTVNYFYHNQIIKYVLSTHDLIHIFLICGWSQRSDTAGADFTGGRKIECWKTSLCGVTSSYILIIYHLHSTSDLVLVRQGDKPQLSLKPVAKLPLTAVESGFHFMRTLGFKDASPVTLLYRTSCADKNIPFMRCH